MYEFNIEWKRLAKLGRCDAYGGKEWSRVSKLWLAGGRTMAVARFIEIHANEQGWGKRTTKAKKGGAK